MLSVEQSDRLPVDARLAGFILITTVKLLAAGAIGWGLLWIVTVPVALLGLASPIAWRAHLLLTLLIGAQVGAFLLKYDIKIAGMKLQGVRTGRSASDSRFALLILSTCGLYLLLGIAVATGVVVGAFAGPLMGLFAALGVLTINETSGRLFEMSLGMLGVKLALWLWLIYRKPTTQQRRELDQIGKAAELFVAGLTGAAPRHPSAA